MRLFTVSTQAPNIPEPLPYGTAVVLLATALAVNVLSIVFRAWLRSRKQW
jgi:phosphate transport system permease protein